MTPETWSQLLAGPVGRSVVLIPVTVAVVEIFKGFIKDRRFWPVLSLAVGIVLSLGCEWALSHPPDWGQAIVVGFGIGLGASGLWSGDRATTSGSWTTVVGRLSGQASEQGKE